MNYEENELEDYARYMEYIRRIIIEENFEFGPIKDMQINIGHIDRVAVCKLDNMESCYWSFQYTIKRPLGTSKNEWTKEMRYTQQIAYDEWKRLQTVETRNKKIDDILKGLEPKHKDILIEGLKSKQTR